MARSIYFNTNASDFNTNYRKLMLAMTGLCRILSNTKNFI